MKKDSLFRSKFFPLFLFLAGLGIGFSLSEFKTFKENQNLSFRLERLYPNGGHLTNPLMQVEGPSGHDPVLASAKRAVESYLRTSLKNNEAASISFYLRDLNKATWVGINEDEKFTIASLAKVPLMFTFYLKAQEDPSILNKKIRYETEIKNPAYQNVAPRESVQLGNTYTVEELLRNMIAYSDNVSMYLLANDNDIDVQLADQIYADLRLPIPRAGSEYEISARDYARYFRILYSATYLNKDSSEKVLKLLTETDFHDGIVAGIPENITVAHKFGERGGGVEGVQLHDCGIVYAPNGPYSICVMTKGWDFDVLKSKIKDISSLAYESMEETKGAQ